MWESAICSKPTAHAGPGGRHPQDGVLSPRSPPRLKPSGAGTHRNSWGTPRLASDFPWAQCLRTRGGHLSKLKARMAEAGGQLTPAPPESAWNRGTEKPEGVTKFPANVSHEAWKRVCNGTQSPCPARTPSRRPCYDLGSVPRLPPSSSAAVPWLRSL